MPEVLKRLAARQTTALLLILGVAVYTVLFAAVPARLDLSISTAVYALLALSVALIYGQAGVLSVAQAGFAAVGAYATAILTTRWDIPPLISLFAAILLPALLGFLLSRVVGSLSHLSLAVATLVFGEIVTIVLREGGTLTGGYVGLSGIPGLAFAPDLLAYHLLAWGVVIVVVILCSNLITTTRGRAYQTIGHDPLRAEADGINVPKSTALLFGCSAGLAGLAGWLYAHYMTFLAPESLPASLSITVVLMVVVGGRRHIAGAIVGTILLVALQNAMPTEESQGLLYGAVLVLVLIAAPDGLVGLVNWWRDRRRRAARPVTHEPTAQEV